MEDGERRTLRFRSGTLARKSKGWGDLGITRPGGGEKFCSFLFLAFLHPVSEVPPARLVLLNEAGTEKKLVGDRSPVIHSYSVKVWKLCVINSNFHCDTNDVSFDEREQVIANVMLY